MIRFLLPLLLSSCSLSYVTEVGVLSPSFGLRSTFRPETNSISAIKTSQRIALSFHPAISFEVGPTTTQSHQGQLQGAEIAIRARVPGYIRPYVIFVTGMHYAPGWRESNVQYSFTTEAGAGIELEILPKVFLTTDFRLFHHSNGKTFFSDSTRQFFGLPKAEKNEGYENAGIFVGVMYEF